VAGRLISKDFLWRVWARAEEDEIFGRSAQLSYYFLLALFPLLLFLITLFGYFDGAMQMFSEGHLTPLSTQLNAAPVSLQEAMSALRPI